MTDLSIAIPGSAPTPVGTYTNHDGVHRHTVGPDVERQQFTREVDAFKKAEQQQPRWQATTGNGSDVHRVVFRGCRDHRGCG